jgi:predicted lipoprotein with Yx(FWY)xxD motif
MFNCTKRFGSASLLLTILVFAASAILGQPAAFGQTSATPKTERWLHVRVINSDNKGETVRVNVPLDLAESVLPTINKDHLHNGKVTIDQAHLNDVDLHALMAAVRNAKDGEYVTVQGTDQDVRVAKEGGRLLVHVKDKSRGDHSKHSEVEIKIPMHVIDALLSAGKDELDVVAALHALGQQGDTELVSVKDEGSTIRVWLDSKNVGD